MQKKSNNPSIREFRLAIWNDWGARMSGMFSVPFSGLATFTDPKYGQPIWIALAIIAIAITAIAITVYRVWANERKRVIELEEKIIPKLRLSCDKNTPGCIVQTALSTSKTVFMNGQMQVITDSVKVKYIRIAVDIDGTSAVHGCSGVINLITKNSVPVMNGENLQLPFAPANQPDALAKTIKDKITAYLDVLSLTENNTVIITTKVGNENYFYPNSFDFNTMFDEPAEYEFTIIVSGQDIGSSCVLLKFNWTGDWQTAEVLCHAVNILA